MKFIYFVFSVFIIGLFGSVNLKAQINLGVQGGMSVPDLSGGTNEISQGYTSRLAPSFGILGNYKLNNNFYIQAEINFDGQGGQRNGIQPITSSDIPIQPPNGYFYANFKNVSVLNYLEIPITIKYVFGNSLLKYFVDAGPYFGYLLSAKEVTSGMSTIYIDKNGSPLLIPAPPTYQTEEPVPPQSFDATTDVYSSLNKINAGLTGGFGILYPISSSQGIILELKGMYGLTVIQKYSADGKSHTGNLVVEAGYEFNLGI